VVPLEEGAKTVEYGCELLFDAATAERVKEIARALPGGCACENGRRCLLLPADGPELDALLDERMPIPPGKIAV